MNLITMGTRLLGAGCAIGLLAAAEAQTTSVRLPVDGVSDKKLFISSRHAPDTDFSAYRTWAWAAVDEGERNPVLTRNPALQGWIENGIEAALTAKGYPKTGIGEADLVVSYEVSVQDVSVLQTRRFRPSHGYTRGSLQGFQEVTASDTVPEGTLTLDLIDPRGRQVVWLGRVSALVADAVTDRGIARAAAELLERFPPK